MSQNPSVALFAVGILKYERCGGRLRIVEIAKRPDDIRRVPDERSWSRAPPRGPPRAELPVQGQLGFARKWAR